jgi:hypothetical protein
MRLPIGSSRMRSMRLFALRGEYSTSKRTARETSGALAFGIYSVYCSGPKLPGVAVPKSDLSFDPREYAMVAERITQFYERHPTGRIVTELIARTEREVTFRAAVFRDSGDRDPAATGWASEREGDGDVNLVACLENTETSAIGRALANLGFTASRKRPSREEMEKAERGRVRYAPTDVGLRAVRETRVADLALQARADALMDVLRLLEPAQWVGMRPARAESIRKKLQASPPAVAVLERVGRRLRNWIRRRANSEGCPPPVSHP